MNRASHGAATSQLSDTPSNDADQPAAGGAAGSARNLWLHAAGLLVVLVGLLLYLDNGALTVPDEGVYVAQASNLADGSWSSVRPALDIDPEGLLTPVADGGVQGERNVPYFKHPLYPIVLTPAVAVAGAFGASAMSILGTWGAAVAAAFIARRYRPSYGPWALWLLGVASPLLFDGMLAVAHSLSAAFAGLAFLGVVRSVEDRRPVHLLYALPAVAFVVALRTEGVALAAALGAVVGMSAIGWPPLRRFSWLRVLTGTAVLIAGAAAYVADKAAADSIAGASRIVSPVGRLSSDSVDPLSGAWASLLRPFEGSWINAGYLLPLAALAIVMAAVALKARPSFVLLPLALLIGAAVAALGLWIQPPGLVTGLFAAFPLLLAALISLSREDLRVGATALALAVSLLYSGAVIATNYSLGGADEWGGRFFHLLLPILVPVMVVGLARASTALSPVQRGISVACIAIALLSISGAALQTIAELRRSVADLVDGSASFARSEDIDLIAISRLRADGAGRYFWKVRDPEVLSTLGLSNLHYLLGSAKAVGRPRVLIVTDVEPDLFAAAAGRALDALDWEVLKESSTPGGEAQLYVVGPSEP